MPGLKDWLMKATGDLKVAKLLLHEDDVLDIAVYHTHQCAEKALKTYLVFRQSKVLKSHDLQKLLETCAQKDASFAKLLDTILILNPYGIYSRYPDDRFVINQEDTKEAIEAAQKILDFVKKKITPSPNRTMDLFEK